MTRAFPLRLLLSGLLALLVACADDLLPPLAHPDADVRLELDARKVASGEPVMATVQVVQADGVELSVGEPAAEGLEAALEEERTEPFDGWSLTTRRYALRGSPGSYVVSVGGASALHPDGRQEQLEVPPAFVDIGVDGPMAELEGLAMPVPPEPPTWPWVLAAGVLIGLLIATLIWWWRRRKRATQRVLAEPPHVSALLAWQVVLEDRALSDHARALQLSEVFRRYLEAVHPMAATALTTREICDVIYAQGLVPGALLDRARRILSATDLLKFARQGGGVEFFHELDRDFQAYVAATRPGWSAVAEDEVRHG
jgi:hypothetical protein